MIDPPKPPWTALGRRIESATRKAIFEFELLQGVSRLGVALSGGKDSLTLLFMLKAIMGFGEPKIELVGLHVGGDFSCGAGVGSSFLTDCCKQLEVPLEVRTAHPVEKLECYSCSRRRRKLLFDMATERGCSAVAFGHHRDDNAQTTLMNLLHKGEFSGLLPKIRLHAYKMTVIRPLIYVDEASIVSFARQCGFNRISCRCPVGQGSMRKQSDGLLDVLSSVFPNARANVASASLKYGSKKALRVSIQKPLDSSNLLLEPAERRLVDGFGLDHTLNAPPHPIKESDDPLISPVGNIRLKNPQKPS